MVDKEYAPLSSMCVKALNDKLYERRKVGALEVEKLMKDFVQQNQDQQIKAVLKILGEGFALSSNPNARKGGLIGLAAAAIALGKESGRYVNELVKPVLACFRDADSQVRYYSCEALYNIVKVSRGSVLPFFNEIFDALSKLCADPDQNVKSGTEVLDRLMKDIVTESSSFDLVSFIPLLREKIYNKNEFARQFIVSWIITLDAVPDINMLVLLPEFLDGMFQILDDRKPEIRKMCEDALREFLESIKASKTYVNFPQMANILIMHSENKDDEIICSTAMEWLNAFVALAGRVMVPYVSGILRAILLRLVVEDIDTRNKRKVREAAEALNRALMELIEDLDDHPTPALNTPSQERAFIGETTPPEEPAREITVTPKGEVTSTKGGVNTTDIEGQLYKLSTSDVSARSLQLDVRSVIAVLCGLVHHPEFQTRIATLRWFKHLLEKVPNKTFRHMSLVFPELMRTLADIDQSDEAMLLALETLAKITSHPIDLSAISMETTPDSSVSITQKDKSETQKENLKAGKENQKDNKNTKDTSVQDNLKNSGTFGVTNKYFLEFMVQLIESFKNNRKLLEKRGPFIIRQLCLLLSSEDIFRSLSEILVLEEDVKFACTMVQTLNTILLTSTELFDLRNLLKDLNSPESVELFCCLYRSWSHSPVATLALCYLTQNYTHACTLIHVFGNLEITVDFLNEIDKLIQLIESPIFAYLRLQLLDEASSGELVKSLYGLLMLLPQAEPFTLLRNRLACIPQFQMLAMADQRHSKTKTKKGSPVSEGKLDELLEHFNKVQALHRQARRKYGVYTAGFIT